MARFPLFITVAVVCLGGVTSQAQTAGRPISPAVQTIPYQRKPVPAPTPPPMSGTVTQSQRPADPAPTGPAAPPEVTYRDGLLSVQAVNSSLGSVVTAIRNKTGIEFEGAENAPERVVLSVGPAPEGDVLSQIFAGSKYDYVAIGRPDSPGIVQRVILTTKSKGGAPGAAAPQAPAGQDADEEDTPDEQPNEPQDTPVQPPNQAQQPQTQPQQQQQPKTPEQLLQELQQMQQQKSGVSDPNAAQAPRKTQPQ